MIAILQGFFFLIAGAPRLLLSSGLCVERNTTNTLLELMMNTNVDCFTFFSSGACGPANLCGEADVFFFFKALRGTKWDRVLQSVE